MTERLIEWERLLETDAPPGARLCRALLTTYDRADTRLLTEHVLPVFLRVSRSSTSEGRERQHFLMEMDKALKDRDQDIVIVSSSARDEAAADAEDESAVPTDYPWVSRRLRQYVVGKTGPAVQHAKLWLFHWGPSAPDEPEHLEIVVSSANLTRSAFRQQLQGAWRVCLPLAKSTSAARLAAWHVLPNFLDALAQSAGIPEGLQPFQDLLARAECPDDVTFVASVPGVHDRATLRRTPWGSAGLQQIAPAGSAPLTVTVLCPFVGGWDPESFAAWATDAGVEPRRVELVWIDTNHPWARVPYWTLPSTSLRTLRAANITLRQLLTQPGANDMLHSEHRVDDGRWSHIKAYRLQRRRTSTVILTSANFSPSAWGYRTSTAALRIKNFELGVALQSSPWPLADLRIFGDDASVHTTEATSAPADALISWGQAKWDGVRVEVECRCAPSHSVMAAVYGGGEPVVCSLPDSELPDALLRSGAVEWPTPHTPPVSVTLAVDGVVYVTVAVLDCREKAERDDEIPDGVDEDLAEEIRHALLFEQYGGAYLSDAEEDADDTEEINDNGDDEQLLDEEDAALSPQALLDGDVLNNHDAVDPAASGGYGVPAMEKARVYWRIVDNWGARIAAAHDDHERRQLLDDGPRLREAFSAVAAADRRRHRDDHAIGAELAAEELTHRLAQLLLVHDSAPHSRRGGRRA